MNIKFVVARYENDNFEGFLSETIKNYEHEMIWNDEGNSIFEKYNLGVSRLVQKGLNGDDVVCFCHADIKFVDPDWEEKVKYAFQNIQGLGVAGVIGATELHETGGWWLSDQSLHRGHVMQWVEDKEENKYHMIRKEGNFTDCCVVDGLCMFVMGHIAQNLKWDYQTFSESYDMYDLDYCLSVMGHGYKVAVLDILLEHRSAGVGVMKDSWKINKEKFINKWKSSGVNFPIKVRIKNV